MGVLTIVFSQTNSPVACQKHCLNEDGEDIINEINIINEIKINVYSKLVVQDTLSGRMKIDS